MSIYRAITTGDSRDIIVDIFQVLIENKELSSENILEKVIAQRKKLKLPLIEIAPSNIRRQIKRLKDIFFVEKIGNNYRINENAKLKDLWEEKIKEFLLKTITDRVNQYFDTLFQQIAQCLKHHFPLLRPD